MILLEHLFYLDWSCDAARGSNKTREKNIINYTIFARRLLGQFPISFYILYQHRTEDPRRPHKYLINSYLWQFFLYSLFNRALCTPSPETLNFCLVFGIHSNFHSLWAVVGWLVGGLVGRKFFGGLFYFATFLQQSYRLEGHFENTYDDCWQQQHDEYWTGKSTIQIGLININMTTNLNVRKLTQKKRKKLFFIKRTSFVKVLYFLWKKNNIFYFYFQDTNIICLCIENFIPWFVLFAFWTHLLPKFMIGLIPTRLR